jgi:hypothetical protein
VSCERRGPGEGVAKRAVLKMLKEQVKGIKKSVFGVIEVSENPEIKREKWLRDWRGCFRTAK